ncbi:hypothetical protein [Xylella fastidiosa]|uniref:hypothetical protein n=1 Tax=Xylella fastidiosa TaxID=2371 RepID=UPI003D05E30C
MLLDYDGGRSNCHNGTPTHLASAAMLSTLIVDLPFSTRLIHGCANPVLSLITRWLSFAALRALLKLEANMRRSSGMILFFFGAPVFPCLCVAPFMQSKDASQINLVL